MTKRTAISLALAAVPALWAAHHAARAQARPRLTPARSHAVRPQRGPDVDKAVADLGLTETQVMGVKAAWEDYQKQVADWEARNADAQVKLAENARKAAAGKDRALAGAVRDAQRQLRDERTNLMTTFEAQIKAVVAAEKAEWVLVGLGLRRAPRAEAKLEQLINSLRRVGLTQPQQVKIKALCDELCEKILTEVLTDKQREGLPQTEPDRRQPAEGAEPGR